MLTIKAVQPHSPELVDFLALPQKLYGKGHLMQSPEEEVSLISGTHPLSPEIEVRAFVGYHDQQVQIRGLLTYYPVDGTCFLGYFESLDDVGMAKQFIAYIADQARDLGAEKLIGPVQASFWLGYRMQLSGHEDLPFTGEPHQPAYYPKLWETAGFKLTESYLSNFYPKVSPTTQEAKLAKRYEAALAAGIKIRSPHKSDWTEVSLQVFELLNRLYRDFPIYRSLHVAQFSAIFEKYRYILDFSMVKLAYQEEKLVGFLITMPDYGALVYQKLNLFTLAKLLWIKHRAKRYIILYLGVDPQYLGLGSALSYPIFKQAQARGASAVGALIHQHTLTRHYAADLQGTSHTYGLYQLLL